MIIIYFFVSSFYPVNAKHQMSHCHIVTFVLHVWRRISLIANNIERFACLHKLWRYASRVSKIPYFSFKTMLKFSFSQLFFHAWHVFLSCMKEILFIFFGFSLDFHLLWVVRLEYRMHLGNTANKERKCSAIRLSNLSSWLRFKNMICFYTMSS